VVLCIRPENVTVSGIALASPTIVTNTFPGTVEKITPVGHYRKVQINCGFPLTAYVANPSFSDLSLKEGTVVLASFDAKAIHVIRKGSSGDP
jgi:molybdopterin-binding protein